MSNYPRPIEQALKEFLSNRRNEENFRPIDKHYRSKLYAYFAQHGNLSEDLTQKTIFLVYQRAEQFRGNSVEEFSGWVFQIADNALRDYLRGQQTDKRRGITISLNGDGGDSEDAAQPLDFPDTASTPLDKLLEEEFLQKLEEALMRLSQQQRKCMRLQIKGWKIKEIAIMLKIAPSTIKSHLEKAKEKLADDHEFRKYAPTLWKLIPQE